MTDTTPLSPAAQAVLDAFISKTGEGHRHQSGALAAVLRAAADQVHHHWDGMECVDYLCAIAAELEAQ